MALNYPEFVEIQALLQRGWATRKIQAHLKENGRPIGLNTIYDIKNGKMTVEALPDTKTNEYYKAGDGGRMVEARKRIEKKVEEMQTKIIEDGLKRTEIMETLSDTELINRLLDPSQRAVMSAKELTGISDSASKRNLLRQGKPTEIFEQLDKLDPQQIIQIIQQHGEQPAEPKRISEGGGKISEEQPV